MKDRWFDIHDNAGKIFTDDEVRISFNKDPLVGRVWVMSYAQLAELQHAIASPLIEETRQLPRTAE